MPHTVHGCVRDVGRSDKTAHLLAMNEQGPGRIWIFSADLMKAEQGVYDQAFQGCESLIAIAGVEPAARQV